MKSQIIINVSQNNYSTIFLVFAKSPWTQEQIPRGITQTLWQGVPRLNFESYSENISAHHAGFQKINRCHTQTWIWGIHYMKVKRSLLLWNPWQTSPEVENRGIIAPKRLEQGTRLLLHCFRSFIALSEMCKHNKMMSQTRTTRH